MTTPHLALAILAVQDLPRMRAFYLQVLGWPVCVDEPVYVELQSPAGLRLGLYDRAAFPGNTGEPVGFRPPGPGTSHVELYLHCQELEDAGRRVAEAGGRLLSAQAPRAWGDEAAYYADPEGNVVVVARPAA